MGKCSCWRSGTDFSFGSAKDDREFQESCETIRDTFIGQIVVLVFHLVLMVSLYSIFREKVYLNTLPFICFVCSWFREEDELKSGMVDIIHAIILDMPFVVMQGVKWSAIQTRENIENGVDATSEFSAEYEDAGVVLLNLIVSAISFVLFCSYTLSKMINVRRSAAVTKDDGERKEEAKTNSVAGMNKPSAAV
eukprot:CAMPEP_0114498722 /NCGR_PEP_ID=MMETSP0109-20121206/7026_1 /TAXON_ID=29199 /ORGANISM="Chlorarachnion reptans, Strain CCCM449" /LENGTH=192 /DNA_ID=CAMNT_0001676223 /DNA_START=555 /DNA_END=1133 /DNA_ORIENTATION=-